MATSIQMVLSCIPHPEVDSRSNIGKRILLSSHSSPQCTFRHRGKKLEAEIVHHSGH